MGHASTTFQSSSDWLDGIASPGCWFYTPVKCVNIQSEPLIEPRWRGVPSSVAWRWLSIIQRSPQAKQAVMSNSSWKFTRIS